MRKIKSMNDIDKAAKEYWESKEMSYGMTYSEIRITLNSLKFATMGGFTAGYKQGVKDEKKDKTNQRE